MDSNGLEVIMVIDDGVSPEDKAVARRRWVQIATALRGRGVRLSVATLRARCDLHPLLEDLGCRTFGLSDSTRFHPVRAVARLAKHLRSNPYSIVHGHESLPTVLASGAALLAGCPTRIYHRYHVYSSPRHARVSRFAGALSSRTIAVSHAAAMAARRDDRTDPRRVAVAFNGVRRLRRATDEEIARLRAELKIAGDAHVVLSVSRLRLEKGVDLLIEAARSLPYSVTLLIVGGGPEEDHLRRLALDGPDGARVVFAGHREDVAPFYAMSDVFVLPSRTDACPFTAIEAMSLGVPIVGTKVGGIPEIVDDAVSGLIVPAESPEALASAITAALGDEEHRRSLGKAGLMRYEAKFSLDAMAAAWLREYEFLLSRRP